MSNFLIGALVIGVLLGGFGGSAISKLNPFKDTGKVSVVKQETQREEYFKDQIKGIEYRIKEKGQSQAPVKQTLGGKIGSVIDNSFRMVISFLLITLAVFFFTGINIVKVILDLRRKVTAYRKTLTQTVVGVQNAKTKLNGSKDVLKNELAIAMDSDSKKLIDEVKHEKSI